VTEKYQTFVLQNRQELEEFRKLIKSESVCSYLEIGSKFGGSLWHVANTMPKGSRVVSIDLPWGDGSFKDSQPWLEKCVSTLKSMGYDAHLLIADSHDPSSVDFAKMLGPFDCVMIDGDHTAAGVCADWENYGPLGKMVCFHDISWKFQTSKKALIEAPEFWQEVKQGYRHREIRLEKKHNGIGVLWKS